MPSFVGIPSDATQVAVDSSPASGNNTHAISSGWAYTADSKILVLEASLSGPTEVYAGSVATWQINNFDEFSTYLVSASAGSAAVSENVLTFTAPATPQTVTLTVSVNGVSRAVSIEIVEAISTIGTPGTQGFGVGSYPNVQLPTGFSALTGSTDPTSDNYGNYQYSDSSIMCWIPKFYYRIGSVSSPNYAVYGANAIDITSNFPDESTANFSGYALHRAFINGGVTVDGFMVDKYLCSNNSGTASSIKNGNPLSTHSDHNPLSVLTGSLPNYNYSVIDAAKTRGSSFHCSSRFQFAALALLATAHSQAASSTTYCAWYDGNLTTNFPKGCNNNALKDINDTSVIWVTDGYSYCAKTGSAGHAGGAGNTFAKSTHNGQNCGVADLNGTMWELNLGMTRSGTSSSDTSIQDDTTGFYILNESVDVNTITSGWSDLASGTAAWGTATHLQTLYTAINLTFISSSGLVKYYGNSTSQVLAGDTSHNDNWRMTGVGIPQSGGISNGGSNLFGTDYFYEKQVANLCLGSGGYWNGGASAGIWALYLGDCRTYTYNSNGFRCAAYV